jgi:hypothetical protein
MATIHSVQPATTILLALLALPLQGQINAQALKLPPKSSPVAPSSAKGATAPKQRPVHPPRLSGADYALLRPHLASLLKVAPAALPPNPVQATNLATPGSVVNVKIAGPNPEGAAWYCDKATISNVTQAGLVGGFAWSPTILGNMDGGPSTIQFCMKSLPAGTYLMTAYVSGGRTSFDCKVYHAGGQTTPTAIGQTPAAATLAQSGKVMVPFVLSEANNELRLILELPWNDDRERDRDWIVYSCDFMRIQ